MQYTSKMKTNTPIRHSDSLAHIVKYRYNSASLLPDQIKNILIVREVDERPFYGLTLVLLLLHLQDEIIKLLLQSFVGVVDAT